MRKNPKMNESLLNVLQNSLTINVSSWFCEKVKDSFYISLGHMFPKEKMEEISHFCRTSGTTILDFWTSRFQN